MVFIFKNSVDYHGFNPSSFACFFHSPTMTQKRALGHPFVIIFSPFYIVSKQDASASQGSSQTFRRGDTAFEEFLLTQI